MKRILFMRVVAQCIDIVVSLAILVSALVMLAPLILHWIDMPAVSASITLVVAVGCMFFIQLPFLQVGQTIGKAMCSLEVVDKQGAPSTLGVMLHRELLMKLCTLWFICIPMLAGSPGGHEQATDTTVVPKPKMNHPDKKTGDAK